jgi:hypothetical protein
MDEPLLYDWDELFYDFDFPGKALGFFRTVGHTQAVTPLIVADDVLNCIYTKLNFTAFFKRTERSAFSRIASLSHLFTMDDEAFYRRRNVPVRYYSICIDTPAHERTYIADIIANAFTKNTLDYHVLLFRHENICMLAFTPKNSSAGALFSDWFCEASILEVMRKIDISSTSLKNSNDFFCDLVYMAARRYYFEPVSRDCAHAEWFNQVFYDDNDAYVLPGLKEYLDAAVYAHVIEYGDDYVEEPNFGAYQVDNIDSKDFEFDLLEFEIEEMRKVAKLEFEDESILEEDNIDSYERVYAEDIPTEVMDDPVLLLEWLNKRERVVEEDDDYD